jgi:predicted DNA-binding protein (UPF0251 family)
MFRLLWFTLGSIYNSGGMDGMPKCEVDTALQDQVHRFVGEYGLTVNGAATMLGVNRTTFWRFHETGEALSTTRARIREALANRQKANAARVADDAVGTGASEHQARPMLQGVLADRELKQIRRACEGVLALLNVYEAQQSLARKT